MPYNLYGRSQQMPMKNKILWGVFIGMISFQIGYGVFVFRKEKEMLKKNEIEIAAIRDKIKDYETGTICLSKIEKELEFIQIHKEAILNQVPVYISGSKCIAELLRYIEMHDFLSVHYEKKIEEEDKKEMPLREDRYTISFVGRYDEVMTFMNQLNQSYQVMHLDALKLDNRVQDKKDKDNLVYATYFKDDFQKVVHVTLEMSLYSRFAPDEEKSIEIYQPNLTLETEATSIFAKQDELREEATFRLVIGDKTTPGDTYQFKGPGEIEDVYLGLVSESEVTIRVDLYDSYYIVQMQDTEGTKKEIKQDSILQTAELEILSVSQKENLEALPKINVHVENHTNQELVVRMDDNLGEHIHVVSKVEQKIRLIK